VLLICFRACVFPLSSFCFLLFEYFRFVEHNFFSSLPFFPFFDPTASASTSRFYLLSQTTNVDACTRRGNRGELCLGNKKALTSTNGDFPHLVCSLTSFSLLNPTRLRKTVHIHPLLQIVCGVCDVYCDFFFLVFLLIDQKHKRIENMKPKHARGDIQINQKQQTSAQTETKNSNPFDPKGRWRTNLGKREKKKI